MGKKKNRNHDNKPRIPSLGTGREVCLPTPEFLARHELEKIRLDEKTYALRVKDKRPIDKYHRLYLIDKDRGIGDQYRRGISEDQFRAADRLVSNYERSFPSLSTPLDSVRVQTSVNVNMHPIEAVMHAIHQHTRVMKELSRGSQEIVEEILCKEANLIDYEHAKGWRKGYGMIRLREALDELVDAYKSTSRRRKA